MPEINPLPVSEATREALQGVKDEEESYDDLLQRLVEEHHRFELAERYHDAAALDRDELVVLEIDD